MPSEAEAVAHERGFSASLEPVPRLTTEGRQFILSLPKGSGPTGVSQHPYFPNPVILAGVTGRPATPGSNANRLPASGCAASAVASRFLRALVA